MKLPRLFWWIIATIVLLATVVAVQPQQLPVTLYKLSLVTLAGVVAYWLDRSLFPYARPDMFLAPGMEGEEHCDLDFQDCSIDVAVKADKTLSLIFIGTMLRRAFIVGAAMLAVGLGA